MGGEKLGLNVGGDDSAVGGADTADGIAVGAADGATMKWHKRSYNKRQRYSRDCLKLSIMSNRKRPTVRKVFRRCSALIV